MTMKLEGKIVVYSILGCPHCMRAKSKLKELDLPFMDIRIDIYPHIKDDVFKQSGMKTVPQIFFNDVLVGGCDSLLELVGNKDRLEEYIEKVKNNQLPDGALVIPDESTAVIEEDLFGFECEPDEYFTLVNEMQKNEVIKIQPGGIFKSKKSYFTGTDFVDWVKDKKCLGSEQAMLMGQAILDRQFAKPERPQLKFKNSQTHYVMTDDESDTLNSGPISGCVPKSASAIGEQLRKMILKLYEVFLSPDGKAVNYEAMKSSDEFKSYKRLTRELNRVDIESATREEKLAFFINIYNALVIHSNVEIGPPTSLWGRYKFFNNTKYTIGAYPYSLQDIENGVLRSNRKGVGQFCLPFGKDDPRKKVTLDRHEPLVHFALVCGAKSCPPIKTYTVENIYDELNLAVRAFLENDDACVIDVKNRTVKLSAIFKWYMVDFGTNKKEMLGYVAENMDEGAKLTSLKEVIKSDNYKVSFLKYDWSLNAK